MTRPLYEEIALTQGNSPRARLCGCQSPAAPQFCHALAGTPARSLGFLETSSSSGFAGIDWKTIALVGAGALIVFLVMSNTPRAAVRKVKRMKARAEFRSALKRIKAES